jgi:hypothetical protein
MTRSTLCFAAAMLLAGCGSGLDPFPQPEAKDKTCYRCTYGINGFSTVTSEQPYSCTASEAIQFGQACRAR